MSVSATSGPVIGLLLIAAEDAAGCVCGGMARVRTFIALGCFVSHVGVFSERLSALGRMSTDRGIYLSYGPDADSSGIKTPCCVLPYFCKKTPVPGLSF